MERMTREDIRKQRDFLLIEELYNKMNIYESYGKIILCFEKGELKKAYQETVELVFVQKS
jgi:hypothetical protein